MLPTTQYDVWCTIDQRMDGRRSYIGQIRAVIEMVVPYGQRKEWQRNGFGLKVSKEGSSMEEG
jgi:hypothetical protein